MSTADETSLRAAIAASPDDPEPFLVYADFLLQRGDPVGELIMVMHERATDPDDASLLRREEELLVRSERALLGGLSKHSQYLELTWARGFIRRAQLTNRALTPSRSRLARLVTLLAEAPAALLLDELVLVAPDLTIAQEAVTALETVSLPRLRRLSFAHLSWVDGYDDDGEWMGAVYTNRVAPVEPPHWPRPRQHLTLCCYRLVPRRLPSIVAAADAITLIGADGDTLPRALVALRERRAGTSAPLQLTVVRPTIAAVEQLAVLGLVLDGLALLDASRDALREMGERLGAFAWAPRYGYAIRPRAGAGAAAVELAGLPVTWL